MNIKQTINSFSARTVDRLTSARRATLTMLATFLIAITAQAQAFTESTFSGGDGTSGNPYKISNAADLNQLATDVGRNHSSSSAYNGKYFLVTNDIHFDYSTLAENGSNFTPIRNTSGIHDYPFAGTFDGGGHTISGIRIYDVDGSKLGLFGNLSPAATVKNVILADMHITGKYCCGAIVGESQGIIKDCHVTSTVEINVSSINANCIGGIAGSSGGNNNCNISGCTSAVTIRHTSENDIWDIGGIVGYAQGKVENNLVIGATISASRMNNRQYRYGAIAGYLSDCTCQNNYYTACTVAGLENATGVGIGLIYPGTTFVGDVTENNAAISVYTATLGENITSESFTVFTIPEHKDKVSGSLTTVAAKTYNLAASGTKVTLSYSGATEEGYAVGYKVNSQAISGNTFTMSAANATIAAEFVDVWGVTGGADGSEAKPYIIKKPAGLDLLAQRVNGGNNYNGKFFKLGADIEYDGTTNNFTPIGNSEHSFYGTFDGDGKSISGIKINKPENGEYQGIFGFVDGTVKNLVVSSSSIVAYQNIGAIAGCLRGGTSTGTIENCYVGNDVTLIGHSFIGGIVGQNEGGAIKGCASATTISGTIVNEYNGADILGGIVGKTKPSSTLTDNIFTGTITGDLSEVEVNIGAIVGENDNGTLKNNLHTSTRFGGIGKSGSTTGVDEDNARKAVAIGAVSGVTIKPTGNATTYKTSGITSYADNSVIGYDSKLYAGATEAAKLTITYTVPNGYEFNKIDAGEGVTVTASNDTYTITMPASDVTVDVVYKAIEYTLQYNGADGATFATANPTTYTVESDAITLTNPTKDGYTFAGWTGTGLTEATTTVTIAKGSTGNREYTATWSLADYTITYDLAGGTLAEGVSNPTGYNIDSDDITLNNPTREGYTFAGWTGTGLTEATTTVTIAKGSHENKTFTATWEKNPDTRYVVDDGGVAVTTMAYLAELALDDTMQDYVEKGKLKATITPKNKYWTLACGVDLLLPEGVKVYKARMNSAGTKVELTEIDATTLGGVLKANNGVLIASTPGQTYDLVVSPNNSVTTLSNADAKSYGTDNELEPVLEDTHFTTEDYFILTENKFIMVDISKDTKVPAGKAVLKVAAGSAKTRTLDVIDGETTGISSAVNSADDEVWYNLQGQRISKPSRKGVYILNGKKVKK